MSLRRLFWVDAALLGLMILASRAALLLHEAAGHALVAWLLGASDISIRLSILGGGYAKWGSFPPGQAPRGFGSFALDLSGIGVNLLTGAAAWLVARRLGGRGLLHVFLLMLGAGSVGQALFYLGNGFYYGEGDPKGFVARPENLAALQWVWVAFPPLVGLAAWRAAQDYRDWLAGQFAIETWIRRIGLVAATIGLTFAAYMGLWALTWDSTVDVTMARRRLETEVRKEERRRRVEPPPARPSERRPPPPVREEEVAHRVPAPWSMISMVLACLVGAALGLRRPSPLSLARPIGPRQALVPVGLAAGLLAVLVWL